MKRWCPKCFKTTEHKWFGGLSFCTACTKPVAKVVPKPDPLRRRQYGNIKLSEKQVEEILVKRANGAHAADLAKEYNVTTQTIYDRTRNYNMITISKELLMRWIDERVDERLKELGVVKGAK